MKFSYLVIVVVFIFGIVHTCNSLMMDTQKLIQERKKSCNSCGIECLNACGSRHFKSCCFNYLKKRTLDPEVVPPGAEEESKGFDEQDASYGVKSSTRISDYDYNQLEFWNRFWGKGYE